MEKCINWKTLSYLASSYVLAFPSREAFNFEWILSNQAFQYWTKTDQWVRSFTFWKFLLKVLFFQHKLIFVEPVFPGILMFILSFSDKIYIWQCDFIRSSIFPLTLRNLTFSVSEMTNEILDWILCKFFSFSGMFSQNCIINSDTLWKKE